MRWCFLFVKEERCILFFFKKKRRRRMVFACLCFGEIPVRKRRRRLPARRKKRREEGWSFFFFSVSRKKKKRNAAPFPDVERKKNGKRKRGRASSLVQAFDVLSAAACDEEVVLIVRTVVDIVSEKHLISFFHDGGKIHNKSEKYFPLSSLSSIFFPLNFFIIHIKGVFVDTPHD